MKTYEIILSVDFYQIKEDINEFSRNGYELEQFIPTQDNRFFAVMSKSFSQKKPKKCEKLIDSALAQFEPKCLHKADYWAKEFISHRRKIKKSVKTERPILLFLKELDKLCENGYDVASAVETMKNREWQTLKYEYIAGKDAGDNGVAFM